MGIRCLSWKHALFPLILLNILFNFANNYTMTHINSPSNSIQKSSYRRPNIVDTDMDILRLHPATLKRPSNTDNRRTAVSDHLSRPLTTQKLSQTTSRFKNLNPTIPSPRLTQCRLPPDFWCDDPNVVIECTGKMEYCEKYKRHRRLHKFDIKLAFESGCSDSQKLIVHRLYPRVLSNPEVADAIDFKAHPWGLARRQYDQNIHCHHGYRECSGNRLLSCLINFNKLDQLRKNRIFFCFMSHMMAHGDPEPGMVDCLNRFWADQAAIMEIMECAQSMLANHFQMNDEEMTRKILLRRPRFVPFLSFNRKSSIHMQAPLQLLLPEKIRHWNKTMTKNLNITTTYEEGRKQKYLQNHSSSQNCEFPPEFWCIDPSITQNCFNADLCTQFENVNSNRLIHIRIIYNSQFEASREYLLRYLSGELMNPNSAKFAENSKKMRIELEPAHFTKRALNECGVGNVGFKAIERGCARRILEICISQNVKNAEERNRLLICLNSIPIEMNAEEVFNNWAMNCFPAFENRERILQCAKNERIWTAHNAQMMLQQNQRALSPEPRRSDPWILLNGYSLSTVQNYANVLDQMICLWYTGKGHDREKCGRCDYEPSHC